MVDIAGEKVNNLLITDFEHYPSMAGDVLIIVRIVERYNYTPISAGYRENVFLGDGKSVYRAAVARALDYARSVGIPVVCNNSQINWEIALGIIDGRGVEFIDFTEVYR